MLRRSALPFAVLALAATGALSGCMMFNSGCPSSYDLTFEDRTIDEVGAEVVDDPHEAAFVDRLVAAGTLNETGIGDPSVRNGTYVRADGSYYLLTVTGPEPDRIDGYDMTIEYDSGTTPPADAEVVAYEDLPASDRSAFRFLLPDRRRATSAVSFSGGRSFAYPNASAESASVLLERESTWVRYDGSVFEVTVEGEASVFEYDWRYTATRVAANDSAWHAHVRERFVRDLTLDTPGEREIVRQAIDGGYENCTRTPTGDFGGVVEALATEDHDNGYDGGSWYVRYDGGLYRAELVHAVV